MNKPKKSSNTIRSFGILILIVSSIWFSYSLWNFVNNSVWLDNQYASRGDYEYYYHMIAINSREQMGISGLLVIVGIILTKHKQKDTINNSGEQSGVRLQGNGYTNTSSVNQNDFRNQPVLYSSQDNGITRKLIEIKALKDSGILTEEELAAKINELLSKI